MRPVCVKAEPPVGGREQLHSQCMCHLKAVVLSRNVRPVLCAARRALFLTVRAGRERRAALSPHVAVPGFSHISHSPRHSRGHCQKYLKISTGKYFITVI